MNKNTLQFANRLGLFFVALFALCFAWYYLRPVGQELHADLFRLAYFGFEGMNVVSFLAGAVQSYLWAYVGVVLWQGAGRITKK